MHSPHQPSLPSLPSSSVSNDTLDFPFPSSSASNDILAFPFPSPPPEPSRLLQTPLNSLPTSDIDWAANEIDFGAFETQGNFEWNSMVSWSPPPFSALAEAESHFVFNGEVVPCAGSTETNTTSDDSSTSAASSGQRISESTTCRTAPQSTNPRRERTVSRGSRRKHYAVERRYRTTLNDKYTELASILAQQNVQRICKMHERNWRVRKELDALSRTEDTSSGRGSRQSKTNTLSAAIEIIELLDGSCRTKTAELEVLQTGVADLRHRVLRLLDVKQSTKCPA